MSKISIIGAAGTVGSSFGYHLAVQAIADEIVYVDIPSKHSFTVGQAEDTNHALAYHSDTNVSCGDYSDTENSDIIVITAGKPRQPGQTRIDLAADNIAILDSIINSLLEYNDNFISIITTNPVDLLNRHVFESGDRPRESVLGFGGILDSARFRYTLSKKLSLPVTDIDATILGEHGDSQVPIFSQIKLPGNTTPSFSTDEKESILSSLKESAMRVIEQKKATQWGPSAGLYHMVASILESNNQTYPCSVVLDGEYGLSDVSLGVPIHLCPTGMKEILEWNLSPTEEDALKKSAEKLASEYVLLK